MSLYAGKTVFIVSDKNWQDVLSLIPVAIWSNFYKYPLLIFHQENSAFDADSIIYFLQQYQPEKVFLVGDTPSELDKLLIASPGLGAGLSSNQISRIYPKDYISFWKTFDSLTVVDYNNYETGLMASVASSHSNFPIIFINSNNLANYKGMIDGRSVYIVDNVETSVKDYINSKAKSVTTLSLYDLQNFNSFTDKVILVNPNDLNIKVTESFKPEKSSSYISELYGKTSLAAPILAAAKNELIISTKVLATSAICNCNCYEQCSGAGVERECEQVCSCSSECQNARTSCGSNADCKAKSTTNWNYKSVDSDFTSKLTSAFKIPSMENKICKVGDACSSAPDTIDLKVKVADENGFTYVFKMPENFDNVAYIDYNDLIEVNNYACLNQMKITIKETNKEFPVYCSLTNDYMLPGFIFCSVQLGKDILPTGADKFTLTVKAPGCQMVNWKNASLRVYYTGSQATFFPLEESYASDKIVKITGVKAGNSLKFNFDDLSYQAYGGFHSINHYIYIDVCEGTTQFICDGPYVNGKKSNIVYSDDLVNGLTIELKTYLPFMPVRSIDLIPRLDQTTFLTIFASDDAIQMTTEGTALPGWNDRFQVDGYYSVLNPGFDPILNDVNPKYSLYDHLITGRIFGLTISDVSSYVARDIFFDDIPKNRKALFMVKGTSPDETASQLRNVYSYDIFDIKPQFTDGTYECYSYNDPVFGCDTNINTIKSMYPLSYLIFYYGHGWYTESMLTTSGSGGNLYGKYLQPSIILMEACDTCDFYKSKTFSDTKSLHCAQHLRRGALGYIGAVTPVAEFEGSFRHYFSYLFKNGYTMGEAYAKDVKDYSWGWNFAYIVLGDPTFKPEYWS
jgi:hypothetical protein